jgi:hypothetical protein
MRAGVYNNDAGISPGVKSAGERRTALCCRRLAFEPWGHKAAIKGRLRPESAEGALPHGADNVLNTNYVPGACDARRNLPSSATHRDALAMTLASPLARFGL